MPSFNFKNRLKDTLLFSSSLACFVSPGTGTEFLSAKPWSGEKVKKWED